MTVSINELKSGLTINVAGEVYTIIDVDHVKPGKGAAFVRTKLRNLKDNTVQDMTFKGNERIEEAFVEERKLKYLYPSSGLYHFMDQENFEEVVFGEEALADKKNFLKEELEVTGYFYGNRTLNINLPNFIEFEVVHTEPGVRGDTAKSGTKPAKLESGAIVQVPLFINIGDKIKVDTRTGEYVGRV